MRNMKRGCGDLTYTTGESTTLEINGTPQKVSTTAALGVATKGALTMQWEARNLVTRYTMVTPRGESIPCVMRRSLQDGLMIVKIILADFYVVRVFAQLDKEGDYVLGAPTVTKAGVSDDSVYQRQISDIMASRQQQQQADRERAKEETAASKHGLTGSATTMGKGRRKSRDDTNFLQSGGAGPGSSVLQAAAANDDARRASRKLSDINLNDIETAARSFGPISGEGTGIGSAPRDGSGGGKPAGRKSRFFGRTTFSQKTDA